MENNNGYFTYKTLQGDTWDSISLDFYDDEHYTNVLLVANPEYQNILIFDTDIDVIIPIIEEDTPETLPPWKRSDNT